MGCQGKGRIYGDQDAAYFRTLEQERMGETAGDAEYYSLNRGKNVDALYGEPDNDPLYGGSNPLSPRGTSQTHDLSWNFCPDIAQGDPQFIVTAIFEFQEMENRQPMVREEGKYVEYDAIMYMSQGAWECAIEALADTLACAQGRTPKEGDVIYGFNEWWDVVKAGRGGNVLSTPTTVGYRLDLKKRTMFTPDRKVNL